MTVSMTLYGEYAMAFRRVRESLSVSLEVQEEGRDGVLILFPSRERLREFSRRIAVLLEENADEARS